MNPHWTNENVDLLSMLNLSPELPRRTIIRAKRTLPINRVPPPVSAAIPNEDNVKINDRTEARTNQKKLCNVVSEQENSFSLETFSLNLAQKIIAMAKEKLGKRR